MLIPTEVYDKASLANPGTDYWCKTAAHFYINPPGISAAEACVWGTNQQDVGNWSPYVAGTNTDDSGETFIKLGWNPIYLEPTTPFRTKMPDWGVRIECPDGKCNGLPCEINPSENAVNQMKGSTSNGAGGGAFCVVTVPKGSTANFVVFGGSGAGWSDGHFGGGPGGWHGGPGSSSSTTTYAESSTTSTTAEWSSSTWSASNSSSSTTWYGPGPSHNPNKNLFDTGAESSSATPTPTASKTGSTRPTHTPALATGAASKQQLSLSGAVFAMAAAALL